MFLLIVVIVVKLYISRTSSAVEKLHLLIFSCLLLFFGRPNRIFPTSLAQDIGFFDTKSVGDLTSRLGSDCQQLSHVIGNDMNLIIRNVLQVGYGLLFRFCVKA